VSRFHSLAVPILEKLTADKEPSVTDKQQSVTNGIRKATDKQQSVTNGIRKVSDKQQSVTDGIRKVSDKQQSVTDGIRKVSDKQQSVTDGIRKATDKQQSVTNGIRKVTDKQQSVTDGIRKMMAEATFCRFTWLKRHFNPIQGRQNPFPPCPAAIRVVIIYIWERARPGHNFPRPRGNPGALKNLMGQAVCGRKQPVAKARPVPPGAARSPVFKLRPSAIACSCPIRSYNGC
jgi:hypothetical protein